MYEKEDLLISGPGKYHGLQLLPGGRAWRSAARTRARREDERPAGGRERDCCRRAQASHGGILMAVFYISAAVAVVGDAAGRSRGQRRARAAVPDRVAAGGGGGLLHPGRAVRGRAGGHRLRRGDHGAVRLRGHDAEPRAEATAEQERRWLQPRAWIGPALLALVLLARAGADHHRPPARAAGGRAAAAVGAAKQVGLALFGPYVLGVELASLLLLAGLVGRLSTWAGGAAEDDGAEEGRAHDGHRSHASTACCWPPCCSSRPGRRAGRGATSSSC